MDSLTMLFTGLKKLLVLGSLCALMMLRMVDFAVLDSEFTHDDLSFSQMHSIAPDHASEEVGHEFGEGKTLHVGIHTLLGAMMDSQDLADTTVSFVPFVYIEAGDETANTRQYSPPVPPPLA